MIDVTAYTIKMTGKVSEILTSRISFKDRNIRFLWAYRIVRYILGGIFAWAGISKLMAPRTFAQLISSYELIPDVLLLPVAIGLPLLELIAGIGLIFDVRGSLEIVTGLILLFIFILWFGILIGLDIDCGCFSPIELREHDSLRYALYRDFLFLGLASYLFMCRWKGAKSLKS